MATLLVEYNRRHRTNFIWPCQAGTAFFNDEKGDPAIAALTSLQGQSFSTCDRCLLPYTGVVIELFAPGNSANVDFVSLGHNHVAPDIDVIKFMSEKNLKVIPYFAQNNRDLEIWVWKWFTSCYSMDSASWRNFHKHKRSALDQMAWTAFHDSFAYSRFYQLCLTFLPGRKYILYS